MNEMKFAEKVRATKPIVHCITNTITIWDCANLLLAAGASPTMAHHPEEVAEITAGCDALVLNLGAMNDFDAMLAAAPVAEKLGHPIVVDPVGCGGSSFRRARFFQLAKVAQITCVRGNASEIRSLCENTTTIAGVDALEEFAPDVTTNQATPDQGVGNREVTNEQAKAMATLRSEAMSLATRLHTIVIVSGPVDFITDGTDFYEVTAGDPMMSRITGTGCMSTALLGAYLTVEKSAEAAAAACTIMGHCGEVAAERTRREDGGTMTFHNYLIDAMSKISL